jgi:RimJ/RimL family protein N-acetyltransferase
MAALPDITTARLRIVAFDERHLTGRYVGWLNDAEVVRYSEQRHRRHDLASCRDYFEAMRRSDGYFSAIEDTQTGQGHVGNVTVAVDAPNRLADIAILIGERGRWGNGLGLEAWTAVMRALLEREGFRKVTGGAVASNRAMIRIMEKSGMTPDGRRRAHHLVGGIGEDVVYYAAFSAQE